MPIAMRVLFVSCLVCAQAFSTGPSRAMGSRADALSALGRAEKAHDALEFDESRRLARQALELGGHSKDAVERLWYLVAIASAALDEPSLAKEAFSRVLILNPDVTIDRGLSPKLKSPFMEAKGTAQEPLYAKVAIERNSGGVLLMLTDGLAWVHEAELRARVTPRGAFTRSIVTIEDNRAFVPLHGLKQYAQYSLVLTDEHQNQLFTLGSPTDPVEIGRYPARATVTTAQDERDAFSSDREDASATPYLVTGWTMFGLGLGAAAVGVPYHLRREERAREWNGSECERQGAGTRSAQCGDVDRERARAQKYATILYASGGGLALLGLVTIGLAPSEEHAQRGAAQVACGLGYLALACNGAF